MEFIFLLYDDNKAIILGAYLKRSQKIPKKIQDTMKKHRKTKCGGAVSFAYLGKLFAQYISYFLCCEPE